MVNLRDRSLPCVHVTLQMSCPLFLTYFSCSHIMHILLSRFLILSLIFTHKNSLKYFISNTFTVILLIKLTPHDSEPYNTVGGTIIFIISALVATNRSLLLYKQSELPSSLALYFTISLFPLFHFH